VIDVEIALLEPHDEQRRFIECEAKRIMIRAGRRGGKTVGVATRATLAFLSGRRVLYTAPTSEQTDTFWRHVNRNLRPVLEHELCPFKKNESERFIELPNTEQRIKAKTAWNADTLRGDYGDLIIYDEFQLMDEDAWREVGAPMLLDNNGDAIFIYTPPSLRSMKGTKARDKRHAAKLFKKAQADKTGRWATFSFSSYKNPYLSADALAEIASDMTGISYRREILAEDIDEVPGALWTRATLEDNRRSIVPEFVRIVVAVDPKTSVEADSETGIIVAGLASDGHGYVLADRSVDASPEQWALRVVNAYYDNEADRIVAESNQGGDMVASVIRMHDRSVPVRMVRATRGKVTRAEPVAALYEQGLVHHVGNFSELEDQLATWVQGDPSPDRLDALVWALTELMVKQRANREIRSFQG
jgi:phage terminase large subunit-like protein